MTFQEQFSRVVRLRRQTIMLHDGNHAALSHISNSGVQMVRATHDTVDDIVAYAPTATTISQFQSFLADGRLGVQAYVDGHAAGHAWATISDTRSQVVNGYFRLPPGAALIHHCRVSTSYRGRAIYGAMLVNLAGVLHDSGSQRVFLDAESVNKSSIQGAMRAGFAVTGTAWYLQVAGRTVAAHQPPL